MASAPVPVVHDDDESVGGAHRTVPAESGSADAGRGAGDPGEMSSPRDRFVCTGLSLCWDDGRVHRYVVDGGDAADGLGATASRRLAIIRRDALIATILDLAHSAVAFEAQRAPPVLRRAAFAGTRPPALADAQFRPRAPAACSTPPTPFS